MCVGGRFLGDQAVHWSGYRLSAERFWLRGEEYAEDSYDDGFWEVAAEQCEWLIDVDVLIDLLWFSDDIVLGWEWIFGFKNFWFLFVADNQRMTIDKSMVSVQNE